MVLKPIQPSVECHRYEDKILYSGKHAKPWPDCQIYTAKNGIHGRSPKQNADQNNAISISNFLISMAFGKYIMWTEKKKNYILCESKNISEFY